MTYHPIPDPAFTRLRHWLNMVELASRMDGSSDQKSMAAICDGKKHVDQDYDHDHCDNDPDRSCDRRRQGDQRNHPPYQTKNQGENQQGNQE